VSATLAATHAADRVALALRRLDGFAVADHPLAGYTTYRVGGAAAVFATPRSIDELREIGATALATGLQVLVVGRGSNMLVADAGFDGIAVSLAAMCAHIEIEATTVRAGAAVALPVLARRTAAAGLTGFEWAVGVPGSIGGAVRMNAGGHGADIASCLVEARILDLRSGTEATWPAADAGLHFRGSALGDHHVVLAATLLLAPGDVARAEAAIAEIVRWRREHQPGGQNAGSVFVNPVPGELAAAELIDRLALRGFSIGGACVSDKHANFIQASATATAADVRAVMEHVRAQVTAVTGYRLRSEVRLVGFADVDGEP
jgi:UDP-N-acetylmuramate dehydrogenase